jgi:hypothetical protein
VEEPFLSPLPLSLVDMFIYKGFSGQCEVLYHLKVYATIFPPLVQSAFHPSNFISSKWHRFKYLLNLDCICYVSVLPYISSYEIIIVELKG